MNAFAAYEPGAPSFTPSSTTERDPPAAAGAIEATLRFARGGGRTFLARQAVPYPFHITRPHYLDPALPDLATLYLQSASGGLYRGDRLLLSIEAAEGARAHVTSQAATVVHTSSGTGMQVETRLGVARHAMLALTTDPYILFPGTDLSVRTEVTLGHGAAAILTEGFSNHDPGSRNRPFTRLVAACRVQDGAGCVLLDERTPISGPEFTGAVTPLGPFRAMGTALFLGHAAFALDPVRLESALDGLGVLAGCSPLPNAAGWGVRLLALDGGHLRRGLEEAFAIGFHALLPVRPERRRK